MRVQLLQVALLFTAAYGQISSQISSQITTYDLSFDGAAPVSLLWGLDSESTSTYNFYLCAGDETTGAYVCFFLPWLKWGHIRAYHIFRILYRKSSAMVPILLVTWCHFKSTKVSVEMNPMHSKIIPRISGFVNSFCD